MRVTHPYAEPVFKAMNSLRKKYGFGANNVRHRCDCPVCGAKLVNLYFVNGNWQCSKCKRIDEIKKENNNV